jgi:hypothetical protein
MRTSHNAPTGHKLSNFISTSLQPRRWAHIKRSAKKMTTPSSNGISQAMLMGIAAWLGVPLLHMVWMMIDWNLRDPKSPMSGGIPDSATTAFQLMSLALFCLLTFASTVKIHSLVGRLGIVVAATGIAAVVMIFGWLHYVIGNGIDTL